jgi:superfamily II DNA or RNA helicase
MVGRGLRLHESKSNCLVLDFGGNVRRHGLIDKVEPPLKGKKGASLYFDSHHWHRRLQTGLLQPPLSPGSVSLFGAPGTDHRQYAEQVCSEKLLSVTQVDGKELHEWSYDRRFKNDLSDATVIAMVAASIEGANEHASRTTEKAEPKKHRVNRINRRRR